MFIALEGFECSGKSTAAAYLQSLIPNSVVTREPGSTSVAEDIRSILKTGENLYDDTELLLFMAARSDNVRANIKPALEAGRVVISDRYISSSRILQGHGRGIDMSTINFLNNYATGGLSPDLTIFLDVPLGVAFARMEERGLTDRLEADREFMMRCYDGYLVESRTCETPSTIIRSYDLNTVKAKLRQIVANLAI